MLFNIEAIPATFISRPNRFLVVAELYESKKVVHVHCADPGRMRELLISGTQIYVSKAKNPQRKTAYDLRFVVHPANGQLVSVDSQLPNRLFREAMSEGAVPPLSDCHLVQGEVSIPKELHNSDGIRSRIDYLLEDTEGVPVWVEVKSATLVENRVALFPDATTDRGRRHVLELVKLKERTGARAAIAFIVQREDADMLRPQRVIDPAFADAMYFAVESGVETYAYRCSVKLEGIHIDRRIEVVVSATD